MSDPRQPRPKWHHINRPIYKRVISSARNHHALPSSYTVTLECTHKRRLLEPIQRGTPLYCEHCTIMAKED